MNTDNWTLRIQYDDLETQMHADPELRFPNDECSRLIGHLTKTWGILPEDFQEIAEWTTTRITFELETLSSIRDVLDWVATDSVPKTIALIRNKERIG